MSFAELVKDKKIGYKREFIVKIGLVNVNDRQLKHQLDLLREMYGTNAYYNWISELIDIIENK